MCQPKIRTTKRYGFIFLLLSSLTLFLAVSDELVIESGPSLVKNGDFSAGDKHWNVPAHAAELVRFNEDRLAHLRLEDSQKSTVIRQTISTETLQHRVVRLSAKIKTKDVIPGSKTWQRARVMMNVLEPESDQVRSYNPLIKLTGTHDWTFAAKDFSIAPEIKHVVVLAQLPRATGEMWVKDIRLTEMTSRPYYFVIVALVFAIWALFIGDVLLFLLNGNKFVITLSVVCLSSLLFLGTLSPHEWKVAASERLTEKSIAVLDFIQAMQIKGEDVAPEKQATKAGEESFILIAKLGHFAFFFLLSLVLFLQVKHISSLALFGYIMMLACATELLQFFVIDRTPMLYDLVIDAAGAVTAAIAYFVGSWAYRIWR